MLRRASCAVSLAAMVVLTCGAAVSDAAPVRMARHPDYHAGKIAFSYFGDIWVANEDGTSPQRLTDSRGHEMYPRFSPDGRWVAFSSNRYGNNDVFVVSATGGAPRRLTFHTGNDEVVEWTRDSQNVLFRAAHGGGAFPNVATLYHVPVGGGREQALPVDWGYWGTFSPDGKSLVFNRHPAVWTRQHYRGSYAADPWIADLTAKTYTKLLPDERYNRYWPMWGADHAIYYVADPVPNDRNVVPGSPDVRNGEIGYLHIRAMDAPSLRQFQLDLAANRTKRALVIDQRFNGGGGIDQELLGILAGRRYQYTLNRDASIEQARPQNFYGPMVVMENERSASDAEMFPAGFKALGLGKVVGVPSMGAVIGTGSYTLLDGSAIRTPGSGVWTTTGQNMENYGVPPDVFIDNTPGDFLKGRDAQVEKAVEVLKAELAAPKPARPLDAVTAVVDAFMSHPVVALGDGAHGNEQAHAFRLSLIRDPRFAAIVNDIVVECGNARYQEVMDRFVRGEEVADASLRQVWRNTTTPTALWDLPIREDFFRAVRRVNASLPKDRQIRVLLGDPPIDWENVHTREDYQKWLGLRDSFPADLLEREVLAKKRRALVIYGDMHFQRKNLMSNYDMSDPLAYGIVNLLENRHGTSVFTIWTNTDANVDLDTLQADVASWRVPALAILRETTLGAADFTFYYPFKAPRLTVRDGKPDFSAPVPREQWRALRMEDQFDAVLYLGPRAAMTTSQLLPSLCADADYVRTRLARMALAGLPQTETDRLRQICAGVIPK